MSVVYAAVHEQQQREVAIKVLDEAIASDPGAIERFMHEARTASSISHGHVVGVSDFGRLPDGRPYLVMPMLAGTDMATLLSQEGPQSPRRVAALLAGVASALDAMHEHGFVHRDIKSENLMHIRGEDGTETVLVLDFGISAARHGEGGALLDDASGTPEFMAPEVLAGQSCDHRSDVYSLATVAYELITGSLPFDGEDLGEMLAYKTTRKPRTLAQTTGASVPASLEGVLARGLALEPERRPRSAGQLVRELRTAAASLPDAPVKPGAVRPRQARSRTLVGTGSAARAGAAALPAELRVRRDTHRWHRSETADAVPQGERTGTHRRVPPKSAEPGKVKPVKATAPKLKPKAKPARGNGMPPPVVAPPPQAEPVGGMPAPSFSSGTAPALRGGAASERDAEPQVDVELGHELAPFDPFQALGPDLSSAAQTLTGSAAWPLSADSLQPLSADSSQRFEDSLRPASDLESAIDADARALRAQPRRWRWLAYPALAALIALGFVALRRDRTPEAAAPEPVAASASATVPKVAPPSAPAVVPAEPPPPAAVPAVADPAPSVPPPSSTAAAPEAAEPERVPEPVPAEPIAAPRRASARAVAASPSRPRAARSEQPAKKREGKPAAAKPERPAASEPAGDGDRASDLTRKGTAAMLRGDFAAADAAFQQAIAADARHAPAIRGRALVLERMGRAKEAARAFKQYLRVSPQAADAEKMRARLQALESKP